MLKVIQVTLAAALVAASAHSAQAETFKIAIPQKGDWDSMMAEYGVEQGFFKAEGLDVDVTYTDGGATTEQAVISGSVDLAMSTGILGIISAYTKGAPIRIISAEMLGADQFWYALAGRGIATLKDTGGKTVAFSQPGSSSNLAIQALLKEAGVSTAKIVATGAIPGTMTQVMSGQIDVGWSIPPIGLKDVADGKLVVVVRGNDSPQIRNQTTRVNVVNLDVLQKRRDAVIRYARIYQKTLDWAYQDGSKAIDLFAENMQVSHEVAQSAVKQYYAKNVMYPYEIKGLDQTLQDALEFKRIPRPMTAGDLAGLIDMVYHPDAK